MPPPNPTSRHAVREILPESNGPFGRDAFRGYVGIVVFRRQSPMCRRRGARASSAAGLSGCVVSTGRHEVNFDDGPEQVELVPFFKVHDVACFAPSSRSMRRDRTSLFRSTRHAHPWKVFQCGVGGHAARRKRVCSPVLPAECRPNTPILPQSQPLPLKRRTRHPLPRLAFESSVCLSSVWDGIARVPADDYV